MSTKIVSIEMIGETGWNAVIQKIGDDGTAVIPVIAWAKCERNGDQFMTGLIQSGAYLMPCTDHANFIKYIAPGEEFDCE